MCGFTCVCSSCLVTKCWCLKDPWERVGGAAGPQSGSSQLWAVLSRDFWRRAQWRLGCWLDQLVVWSPCGPVAQCRCSKCSGLTCEPGLWLKDERLVSESVTLWSPRELLHFSALVSWYVNGCVLPCCPPCRTVWRPNLVKVLKYLNNLVLTAVMLVLQNLPSAVFGRHEHGEGFI